LKILILGGSRFIGRHLVNVLLEQKHKVYVYNRGNHNQDLPQSVNFLIGDRQDKKALKNIFKEHDFDVLFDLSGFEPADINPVLDSIGASVKHYIFCSSVAVYDFDAGCKSPESDNLPLVSKNKIPQSDFQFYALNKLLCEELLLNWKPDLVSIIRPAYVYGLYDYSDRIFSFFHQIKNKKEMIVPEQVKNSKAQMIYVEDLARAFSNCMMNKATIGKAFDLAYPEVVTFYELIKLCCTVSGGKCKIILSAQKELSFPFPLGLDLELGKASKENILVSCASTSFVEGLTKSYLSWQRGL
jgi:nucleoside-diphosphate-sugar epimerase